MRSERRTLLASANELLAHSQNIRAPRRNVELGALALRINGTQALITVSNLSYDGCELRSRDKFRNGEKLRLNLPRLGQIEAEIRWCNGGKAGARFLLDEALSE